MYKKVKSKKAAVAVAKAVAKKVAKHPRVAAALNPAKEGIINIGVPAAVTFVGSRVVGNMITKAWVASSVKLDTSSFSAGLSSIGKSAKSLAIAQYIPVATNAGLFALLWFLTKKVKSLRKYRTGALVGSAASFVLSAAQILMKKQSALPAPAEQPLPAAQPQGNVLETGEEDEPLEDLSAAEYDPEYAEYQKGVFALNNG